MSFGVSLRRLWTSSLLFANLFSQWTFWFQTSALHESIQENINLKRKKLLWDTSLKLSLQKSQKFRARVERTATGGPKRALFQHSELSSRAQKFNFETTRTKRARSHGWEDPSFCWWRSGAAQPKRIHVLVLPRKGYGALPWAFGLELRWENVRTASRLWGVCAPRHADAKRKRNFWYAVTVKSYVCICVSRLWAVCANSRVIIQGSVLFTPKTAGIHRNAHLFFLWFRGHRVSTRSEALWLCFWRHSSSKQLWFIVQKQLLLTSNFPLWGTAAAIGRWSCLEMTFTLIAKNVICRWRRSDWLFLQKRW